MLRRGGLAKGGEEVEVAEDKSGALTQQGERAESTGQKVGISVRICVFVFHKAT